MVLTLPPKILKLDKDFDQLLVSKISDKTDRHFHMGQKFQSICKYIASYLQTLWKWSVNVELTLLYVWPFILPLIEILKFDWLRQILYAAISCFLTNLIFLIYPLHVTYWPHITFLNPFHVTLPRILHYDGRRRHTALNDNVNIC